MIAHLIFKVLAGRTVCWAQMPVVAHVIEYFLGMDLQLGQVIEIPVNPAPFIPLLEIGWWIVRICPSSSNHIMMQPMLSTTG